MGCLFPAEIEFLISGIAVGEDYELAEVFEPQRWPDGN